MMDVYKTLFEAVDKTVEAFRDDLEVIDRDLIAALDKCDKFLHFAGECGTHMAVLCPADSDYFPAVGKEVPYLFGHADRDHVLNGNVVIVECMLKGKGGHPLVHYYDGRSLSRVTHEQALRIAKDHQERVRCAWRAERARKVV